MSLSRRSERLATRPRWGGFSRAARAVHFGVPSYRPGGRTMPQAEHTVMSQRLGCFMMGTSARAYALFRTRPEAVPLTHPRSVYVCVKNAYAWRHSRRAAHSGESTRLVLEGTGSCSTKSSSGEVHLFSGFNSAEQLSPFASQGQVASAFTEQVALRGVELHLASRRGHRSTGWTTVNEAHCEAAATRAPHEPLSTKRTSFDAAPLGGFSGAARAVHFGVPSYRPGGRTMPPSRARHHVTAPWLLHDGYFCSRVYALFRTRPEAVL